MVIQNMQMMIFTEHWTRLSEGSITVPESTKFMFVLPKWETANWYKSFIHYFEIVEEIPKGTPRVFTIPHRSHFVKGQTDFSHDNRVYLGPLK